MQYLSIESPIENILLKEKGSKFIGYAYAINSENEANERLKEIRELHPKATHHCYAYRLGISGKNYRANDDEEPSGSAGLPIYNQLLANDLTNILLIVVRYYGGTKLGVSGLVKTYKESAKLTLAEATIVTVELHCNLQVSFPFDIQNQIFRLLNKHQAKNIQFEYREQGFIKASVPISQKEKISEKLSEIYTISFEFEDSF